MDDELKDHEGERPDVSGVKAYDTTNKSSRERKQQQWESHREEIHKLYMMENRTLKKTMQIMRDKYNFTPRSAPYLAVSFTYLSDCLEDLSQCPLPMQRY
jgi:Clr5 domain